MHSLEQGVAAARSQTKRLYIGRHAHLELPLSSLVGGDDVLEEVRFPAYGISGLGVLKRRRRQNEMSLRPMLYLRAGGWNKENILGESLFRAPIASVCSSCALQAMPPPCLTGDSSPNVRKIIRSNPSCQATLTAPQLLRRRAEEQPATCAAAMAVSRHGRGRPRVR